MNYDIHYAESSTDPGAAPPQLIAGDTPAVSTQDVPLTVSGTALKQFQPLQRADDITGAYQPWAAGNPIAAVTCFAVPIGNTRKAVYTEGMFNINAIAWPDGTTEAQVDAAQSLGCKFRRLLYSDKRTGNEALGVESGPGDLVLVPAPGAIAGLTQGVALSGRSFVAPEASGAVTYAVASGALPTGTSLNASTGAWTGTPSAAGSYTFAISAVDSIGQHTIGNYTATVAAP